MLAAAAKSVKAAKPGSITAGLSVTGLAAAAQSKAEAAAAAAALKSMGLSSTDATAVTKLTSSSGGIMATMNSIKTGLSDTGMWFYKGLTLDPTSTTLQVIVSYSPFVIILIALLVYFAITRKWFVKKGVQAASVETVGASLNARTSNAPVAVEKFTDAPQPVSADKYTLANLQPLTIKQVGFMGPLPEGEFNASTATGQALRGGFRSFIFQIDYLDTSRDPKQFAPPGVPTLLYRGNDGTLLSSNSADINEVAKTLADLAFRPEVPNYTEPLIIYLHILRTPSAVRDPEGYMSFLSKIATALNPLAPNHLGMTPLGTFNRQKQEATLLNSPLSTFEGQVIVLCNADTTIFRTATTKVNPADDLDFWVNMRVYLNSNDDSFGITQAPAAGVTPSAIVVGLPSLLGLSSQKMDAFAAQAKSQIVIALPSQLKNPSVTELNTAINTLGINIVPLDIFSDPIEKVHALVSEYSNMTFRPKPAVLRNA